MATSYGALAAARGASFAVPQDLVGLLKACRPDLPPRRRSLIDELVASHADASEEPLPYEAFCAAVRMALFA